MHLEELVVVINGPYLILFSNIVVLRTYETGKACELGMAFGEAKILLISWTGTMICPKN